MKRIIYLFSGLLVTLLVMSCTDTESLEVQKLKTYDAQYFENLRAYKKSDHSISFAWYAAYAPIEGVEGYKDPASWGERIKGLPDSLDICSLWMGIPSNDPTLRSYAPIAYADMRYAQETLGTRFVAPTIIRFNHPIYLKDSTAIKFDIPIENTDSTFFDLSEHHDSLGIVVYGDYLVRQVFDNDIDGVDLDYEPEGDWMQGEHLTALVKYIAQYVGPKSANPEKLLCIDYYGQQPTAETEPYVNYFINQTYGGTASQSRIPNWCPNEKFIFTETFGEYWATGGNIIQMSRWQPTTGRKGGFGAFYIGRNYYSDSGIPYNEFRAAIQIQNPSIYK